MSTDITPRQVRKIKTMSGRLFGNDDDAYREMLWGVARVKSCTACNRPQASLIIAHLEKCLGIRPAGPQDRRLHSKAPAPARPEQPPRISASQLWEIKERWGRVCRAADQEKALRSFLKDRMRMPENPEWLSLPEAQKVLNALKAMGLRRATGAAAGK